MSVRKNEFSSLAIRVIGTRISEATGKIVQGTEREDDLRTVLETCRTKHVNLMSSLVKLSNSDSQIYEEIGIEQITIKKEKRRSNFFTLHWLILREEKKTSI